MQKKYHQGVVSIAEGFFCDLGCGLGGYAVLYQVSCRRFGCLCQYPFICQFREKKLHFDRINFITGNLFDTPVKSSCFDTVYPGQVLEHVEDEEEVLREAVRILKPCGKLIISVPKEDLLPSPYHVRTYTAKDLKSLLGPYTHEEILFYPFDARRFTVSLKVIKK